MRSASVEYDQRNELPEPGSSARHHSGRRWIATLTLIGVPVAAWLSGVLPGTVTGAVDSGVDYVVSKTASFGTIMLGGIAIGLVIVLLGKRIRH